MLVYEYASRNLYPSYRYIFSYFVYRLATSQRYPTPYFVRHSYGLLLLFLTLLATQFSKYTMFARGLHDP